jgi:hypothetical protein
VAGNDPGFGIHQDRVIKSELRNAGGDLGDLHIGVRPGIRANGNELVDEPQLDRLHERLQVQGASSTCDPPLISSWESHSSTVGPK